MSKPATPAETALTSFFETLKKAGAADLRGAAWERFAGKGLPNRRVESWRYTDLKQALASVAPLAEGLRAAPELPKAHGFRLVIVDGAYRADLSGAAAPAGVSVQSLRDLLASGDAAALKALAPEGVGGEDAVLALNAALMEDGVAIRVAAGAQIAEPLEIYTLSSASAQSTFTRSLVMLGEGAKATVIDAYAGGAAAQENHALSLSLGAGATLSHISAIEGAAAGGVRIVSLLMTLGAKASLASTCLVEGGGLLRRQIFALLDGEEASISLNGASLLRGRDHADTTLIVEHAQRGGKSRERFRTILDEQSTGVFQGCIKVRKAAQQTDGVMQSRALLLADTATMNNKPELEIFADDVACGHGATCGRLDQDQLFYLAARGVPPVEAESLLLEGFAADVFSEIEDEALRDEMTARVAAWLAARKEA
jgi:Fe-S cluster assembly protein SufD